MLSIGVGHLGLKSHKFVETQSRCGNPECKKTLKNKKHYVITGLVERKSGYWTLIKECKRCGFENISSTGVE